MNTFLHPAMLWAALAVAIPVIIHLIHRRRAVIHKFAAIEFVLRSARKTARAFKLKQLLLLLMRMLLMVAIPLMAARFVLLPNPTESAASDAPSSVVVVLDNSYSMGCERDGMKLFDEAKKQARRLIESLPASDDVSVVALVDFKTQTTLPLTYDKSAVLDVIDEIKLTQSFSRADSALERASAILKPSPKKLHRIVYISDFARNGWDFSTAPFAGVENLPSIELKDVRGDYECKNLSVESLEVLPDYSMGSKQWRVSVRIRNSAKQPAKRVKVSILLDGAPIANGFVDIAPHSDADKIFTVKVATAGDHTIEARLAADSLSIDNRRIAPLPVPPTIRVLLVNGQPSTTPYKDELFYLRNALNPRSLGLSGIKVVETTPDRLIKPAFDKFDVVFLCNVPTLPDAAISALKRFVQKGGGLFISAGDAIQPDFYNSRLVELLPGSLRTPKAPGGTDAAAYKITIGIAPFERTSHRVLAIFDGKSKRALLGARFSKFLPFNPNPKKKKRIILRYTNEQPLLVEYGFGEGTVFLFTSTIDRDWSDFPIRTAFLPLMQESVKYLARSAATKMPPPVVVGVASKLRVPENTTSAMLIYPSGKEQIPLKMVRPKQEDSDASDVQINIPPLPKSGIYTLRLNGAGIELKLIVNVDPSEGDVTKLSKDDLMAYLKSASGGGNVLASTMEGRIEYARYFALLLLLALFAESFLMRSLSRPSKETD